MVNMEMVLIWSVYSVVILAPMLSWQRRFPEKPQIDPLMILIG